MPASSLATARARPGRFFFPSTILVLVSDLVPLAGVLWWGWDAFVLLMLYWMETAVIAFWALARILTLPPTTEDADKSVSERFASRLGMTAFFLVHASAFMGAHLLFLWVVFSGHWKEIIHGPHDFIEKMVLPFALWLPLGLAFIGQGIAFAHDLWTRPQRLLAAGPAQTNAIGAIVGGLYGRIVLMHVTILAGAWAAEKIGSVGPFVLLIAIKTAFDVLVHVSIDLGRIRSAPATA